jgi:hypothetical protein
MAHHDGDNDNNSCNVIRMILLAVHQIFFGGGGVKARNVNSRWV